MGHGTGPPTSTRHYECHSTTFKQRYLNLEDHHHACTTHTFLSAIYSSYESVQCKSHNKLYLKGHISASPAIPTDTVIEE